MIGQGTAAVAGQAVADAITHLLPEDRLSVRALPATELSGFHLRPDMSDTLVVAISQSGTTTDTNRTVDLARGRGATVVSVVNRRGSDLVSKSDGVLFTSDGRDIEMSVASTKAFYSQVAAGFLLAVALRQAITDDRLDAEGTRLLEALRELPAAMEIVLAGRAAIAETAARLAPKRRYWAVVGNGVNRVAAAEIRIKLSELCYKSIACDATEDKKHIDLSAEPLILVCAAALSGSTLADVAKEVAIYRAHKAMPVVIATEGAAGFERRRGRALGPALPPAPRLRAGDHGRPPVRLRGRARHRSPRAADARDARRDRAHGGARASGGQRARYPPPAGRGVDRAFPGRPRRRQLRRTARGLDRGAARPRSCATSAASRRSSPMASSTASRARRRR